MQITDRAKDVIKSGGEWISSIDIENIAVGAERGQCRGDRRAASEVGRAPAADRRAEARARADARAMLALPRRQDRQVVDARRCRVRREIPLGATGKINKLALRETFKDYKLPTAAADGRWPGMGGKRVAEVQEAAEFDTATHENPKETPYPHIAPLDTAAAPDVAYARALEAVKARGWTVVLAEPQEGRIEATEESYWFGFKDDIMIRVRSEGEGSRIDVRSTSRVGLSDLGANARRVRDLLDEIEARIAKGV
jgi:uncharacterized protein (DUF1499 family)